MKSSDLPKGFGETAAIQPCPLIDQSGIAAGTSVVTLDGYLSVEFLSPGDRVVTRNGAMVLKKILSGKAFIETCCLEPEALGKARPEKEITLPATQKVLIRDQLAKQLTGKDYALLPASALTQIEGITRRDPAPVQMYSLIFDEDQICYAGGLELLCPATQKRSDSIAML